MKLTAEAIFAQLETLTNPDAARFALRFFKTGPGEYGEGDLFRGIRVPVLRKIALTFDAVPLAEVIRLLASAFHEDRLLALLMLIRRYSKGDEPLQNRIYELYLEHTRHINNWDLVDVSAGHIVGRYLRFRDRAPLYRLAGSESLWERRIAIVSTFHFIRNEEFSDTLAIAGLLLDDREELIHKAAGWMLREVGKRNQPVEEEFLQRHYHRMPRVMLRYAIERFSEERRRAYLKGLV